MKLFLFTLHGEPLALPAGEVVQVLSPGAIRRLHQEADGIVAEVEDARLPVWTLPGREATGAPAGEATFLRIARTAGGEGLLRIDIAGGLLEVPEEEILPLPAFLFADGQVPYHGLFTEGEHGVVLLDSSRCLS